MKKAFLFLFILFSAFSYAQDSTKVRIKRFFYGVNFSSDYCFRALVNNGGNSAIDKFIFDYNNKTEQAKFGFTSGVNICYIFSGHISLDAGLQYSNKGYQTNNIYLNFGAQVSNLPNSGKIIYSYNCLDIPVKANFTFGKQKTHFIGGIGLTTNVFIAETNSFVGKYTNGSSFKNSSTSTAGFNRFNLSPTISAGIQYNVNPKMFFRIEPTFRYSVLKTHNAPIAEYIWNAGLNLSWYFL